MQQQLITSQRRGILWTPESQPAPTLHPHSQGVRPQWDADSDENWESWYSILCEIFEETREVQAGSLLALADGDSLAQPVKAHLHGTDTVQLHLDSGYTFTIKVAQHGKQYHTVETPQAVWDVYQAYKAAMIALGFRAVKRAQQWSLRFDVSEDRS